MINDVFGPSGAISNQHAANVVHLGNRTPTLHEV